MDKDEHLQEWHDASAAVGALARDEKDFTAAVEAFDKGDAAAFRRILERHDLLQDATRICFWLCTWRCVRVVRLVCRELPTAGLSVEEFHEFSRLVQPLAERADLLKRLVDGLDKGDARGFHAIVEELKLHKYCFFLALWICSFRCRRFCLIVATPAVERPPDPFEDLRESIVALAHLGEDRAAFTKALQYFEKGDAPRFREVLEGVSLLRYCLIFCRWFCHWHCFRLCFVLCHKLPELDLTIPQLREFGLALGHVAGNRDALEAMSAAMLKGDARAWGPLLERLKLSPFCWYVCRWYCHLHCDRRCVIFCPPGCQSVFRYIGGYDVISGINSTAAGNGLTTVDKRAFFSTIRLNGVLCKQHAGGAAEYRFEFRPPGGAWGPLPTSMIARTVIGLWQAPPLNPGDPIQVKPYTVKGAAPNDMVAAITPDGWIQVPQESNVNLPTGNFAPNGNLVNLDTMLLQAWTDIDLTGKNAGQSTTPPPLGLDEKYGLRLVVRRVGQPATATVSGTAESVAIYNRHYDNVRHKGSWAPQDDDDQLGAALVNIDEIGGGCGKVTNTLTIRYTAAHPNLGTFSIGMDGPGGPYTTTLANDGASTPANRFGVATLVLPPGKSVADLKKCAYVVKLSVNLLLTTGDASPDPIGDEVAFCK